MGELLEANSAISVFVHLVEESLDLRGEPCTLLFTARERERERERVGGVWEQKDSPEVCSKLLQLSQTQLSVAILVNRVKDQFYLVHVVLPNLVQQAPGRRSR